MRKGRKIQNEMASPYRNAFQYPFSPRFPAASSCFSCSKFMIPSTGVLLFTKQIRVVCRIKIRGKDRFCVFQKCLYARMLFMNEEDDFVNQW